LAQAELYFGKNRDAAEHITFALTHFPPSIQSDRREKMKKALDGIRPLLGVVRIKVNLSEASVSVDGKPVGVSPIESEVFVDPGAHTVRAELVGYPATERAVEVGKGAWQDVTLTLAQGDGETPKPKEEQGTPGPNKAV